MRPIHLWPARASSAIPTRDWGVTDPIVAAGRRYETHVKLCRACRDNLECAGGVSLYALYVKAVEDEGRLARATAKNTNAQSPARGD